MLTLQTRIKIDEATIRASNLTDKFSEDELGQIGDWVWQGWDMDEASRQGWLGRTEAALDLAMQVTKEKSFPWPNASNIAFPLVTIATLQFHSRAYPALVSGTDLVKCRVLGEDPEGVETARADRIGGFMSYQCLEQDTAWEEQHDRLLINLPIVGCAFKKSYFNATMGHNTSELVLARDFVLSYYAKDVASCRRKTHIVPKYRNEIHEKCLTGVYRDVTKEAWYLAAQSSAPDSQPRDARSGTTPPTTDDAAPFVFLEQHCWLDLDGDGYEEPYIILVDRASRQVLRIVSRIERMEDVAYVGTRIAHITASEYFTKYSFIPSPDGGIYDLGFGILLGPLNESVNTLVNQLVDTGTMANTAGGFLGRGAKIRGGTYTFAPLEWKRVDSTGDDLRKNIFPLPVREPSTTLFNLLSLLIDYTNRVSGATEMLVGQNPGQNTPATTSNEMVEQGLKIYAAIFKRVWRSMKEEFKKLYILNAQNLPLQVRGSGGVQGLREDYLGNPEAVCPAADPNVVSDSMRLNQATAIANRSREVPGYDPVAVELNWLRAMRVQNAKVLFPGKIPEPQPDPKLALGMEEVKLGYAKLQHEKAKFALEIFEEHNLNEAKIAQLQAQATKLLSEAKGAAAEVQIAAINATVGAMRSRNEHLLERARLLLDAKAIDNEASNNGGNVPGVAAGPGDEGLEGDALPESSGAPEPMAAGGFPQ